MTAEPILIPCEGGGQPGHVFEHPVGLAMCKMCGGIVEVAVLVEGAPFVVGHMRKDILAMLERGDFG